MFGIDDAILIPMMVSLAATAGSTAANMSSQAAIRNKQKQQQIAEGIRQRNIDQQRQAAIEAAAPKFTPEATKQQQEQAAGELEQYYQPKQSSFGQDYLADSDAPQEVKDSMARALSGALEKGKNYAKTAANFSAINRAGLGQAFGLNQLGQQVSMLNNQGARSAGILPMELQDAYLKGLPAQYVGAGLQGIGSIANSVAGMNMINNALKVPGTGTAVLGAGALPRSAVGVGALADLYGARH